MLTTSELKQVKHYLELYSKKDSQLPPATTPLNIEDKVAIVQLGQSRLVTIKDLFEAADLGDITFQDCPMADYKRWETEGTLKLNVVYVCNYDETYPAPADDDTGVMQIYLNSYPFIKDNTKYIYDDNQEKYQKEINQELYNTLENLEENKADKSNTYTKTEVDDIVDAETTRATNVEGGINTRLQTVEELAEISVGGGDISIATASDFENPTSAQRAKVPTVGAMLDGYVTIKENTQTGKEELSIGGDAKWILDDTPTPKGDNLIKSGGVYEFDSPNKIIDGRYGLSILSTDFVHQLQYDYETGNLNYDTNRLSTCFIQVFEGQHIEFNHNGYDNYYVLVAFDSSFNIITSNSVRGVNEDRIVEYNVPSNVAYIKLTRRWNMNNTATLYTRVMNNFGGGSTKVLSAEQGKVLNDKINTTYSGQHAPLCVQLTLNTSERKISWISTIYIHEKTIPAGNITWTYTSGYNYYFVLCDIVNDEVVVKKQGSVQSNGNFIWLATIFDNGTIIFVEDSCVKTIVDNNMEINNLIKANPDVKNTKDIINYDAYNTQSAKGRLNPSTGEEELNDNYRISDYIPVTEDSLLTALLATASNSSSACLCGYSSDYTYNADAFKAFPSGEVYKLIATIPTGISYIRYSYNKSLMDAASVEPFVCIFKDDNNIQTASKRLMTIQEYYGLNKVQPYYDYYIKEDFDNFNILKHYVGENEVKTRQEFNIENSLVRMFMHSFTYDSNDYAYTKITSYSGSGIQTKWDKTCPFPAYVTIDRSYLVPEKISEGYVVSTIVKVYDEGTLVRTDEVSGLVYYIPIYNLIPNKKYSYEIYYKTTDNIIHKISAGELSTIGMLRDIYIDGTNNYRDIGGYATTDGHYVKYDKLFRGAELYREGVHEITEKGINEILNNIGIEVEIDFGSQSDSSPIEDDVEFLHGVQYQISSYNAELSGSATGGVIRNVFNAIVERLEQGKKIIFHCSEGCDRTGTMSFVLLAMLGVSESDLAKDYELSSFGGNLRRRDVDVATGNGYPSMISYVKSQTGDTLQEKVTNIMLGFGVTQQDVNAFKELMLE